jgi:hypothetical protein
VHSTGESGLYRAETIEVPVSSRGLPVQEILDAKRGLGKGISGPLELVGSRVTE